MFENFLTTLQPVNLMWIAIGSVVGAIIGALPGLTATMGVALFIPLTFSMPASTGLILLASVYAAASFGGNITAILIKTPGTPDSFFMVMDGYPMTEKGQGQKAIAITTVTATIGGLIGAFTLLFLAPPLAKIAIKFGPAQTFLTSMLGITIIIGLSKDVMLKGLLSAALGFIFATVGMDTISGDLRFTGGLLELYEGVPMIPCVIGLFCCTQVFSLAASRKKQIAIPDEAVSGKADFSLKEFMSMLKITLESSIIGTIVGIIPAAGSMVACGLSYSEARRQSKHPEEFGKGEPTGLASVSAANNAVVGGSLVPLLTLGIPGNGTAAVFLGGLIIHGLVPGPDLFTQHANAVYPLLFGLILCQLCIFIIGMYGGKIFSKVTSIPNSVLIPLIAVFTVLGSFAIRRLLFDVFLMLVFGLVGYYAEKSRISMAPFVLAFILGALVEKHFRRALLLVQSGNTGIFTNPISLILIALNIFCLISPFLGDIKAWLKRSKA
ncbi:MAG: tripartite tricarboxylate transporter permease [Lachnospiraceae bacterium]|nr:tripartite tricarboxylate transporter permease [Lachnospiraceae bacterium]